LFSDPHTIARQQVADESDTLDVGIAVLAAEAESLAQVRTHYIAFQRLDVALKCFQVVFNSLRESALTCAEEACKPDGKASIPHVCHPYFLHKLIATLAQLVSCNGPSPH
jgi:hypothetical protein